MGKLNSPLFNLRCQVKENMQWERGRIKVLVYLKGVEKRRKSKQALLVLLALGCTSGDMFI